MKIPVTTFLKRVLIIDALSCLGMGAMLIAGGGALADLLGLPAALGNGAGLALVPLGLFIFWLGTREAVHPALIWLVILGNVGWTVGSLILVFATPAITALGASFVGGQAAIVLALAALEYVGLERSRAAAGAST